MKKEHILLLTFGTLGVSLLTRINNIYNPILIKPAFYNSDSYFPTPSIVVLEPSFSSLKSSELHYYCANHKYSFKNNDIDEIGGYSYSERFEQPCQECLPRYVDYKLFSYQNNEWIFFPGQTPINWKNPLTKIKDFDKLMLPYKHGFTIQDIDIKQIDKSPLYPRIGILTNSGYPKNQNTINYLKQWYYKVPDFDTTKINKSFWGIHYKIIQQ